MAKSEDMVISAVVRGAGVKQAMRLGVGSQLFTARKAEWKFLETHPEVRKAAFRARFPDFRVYQVDPEELEVIVEQLQRDRADLELAAVFTKYQRMFGELDPRDLSIKVARACERIAVKFRMGEDRDIIRDYTDILSFVQTRADLTGEGKPVGLPFGVPTLDHIFGGMIAPDLITILARQGEMKTWLSLFFATNALISGAKPMYVSIEMDVTQIALRVHTLLSRMLAIKNAKRYRRVFGNMALMRGAVDMREYRRFLRRAHRDIQHGFITPDSNTSEGIEQIEGKVEEHHPDVVFYDYFGLATGEGRVDNWMEAEQFSHGFKALAKRYTIPVILNAQASRKAVDAKEGPDLEHIAYTDALGRDSDRVLSLHLRRGELTCVVKKNRFGPTPTVRFDTDIDQGVLDEIVLPGSARRRRRLQEEEEDE